MADPLSQALDAYVVVGLMMGVIALWHPGNRVKVQMLPTWLLVSAVLVAAVAWPIVLLAMHDDDGDWRG